METTAPTNKEQLAAIADRLHGIVQQFGSLQLSADERAAQKSALAEIAAELELAAKVS